MLLRPYILAFFLAALLVGGSAHAAQAPVLDPPTVNGSVSIQLPKGWVVEAAGGRSVVAAKAPLDKDASGQFQPSLSINQDVGNKFDAAAQQANLAKQVTGYHAVETPTPIVIGGLQGVYFGGTFKSGNGNVDLRTRQYMFTVNNQIFTITFTSLISTWAAHLPIVEASVGTFTVKK